MSENRDTKILPNLNLVVWPWPWLDIHIYIYIYIYMYRTSVHAYAHAFIVVVLVLVVNMYILNSLMQRALKRSQPRQEKQLGYCTHENERESPTGGRNS